MNNQEKQAKLQEVKNILQQIELNDSQIVEASKFLEKLGLEPVPQASSVNVPLEQIHHQLTNNCQCQAMKDRLDEQINNCTNHLKIAKSIYIEDYRNSLNRLLQLKQDLFEE